MQQTNTPFLPIIKALAAQADLVALAVDLVRLQISYFFFCFCFCIYFCVEPLTSFKLHEQAAVLRLLLALAVVPAGLEADIASTRCPVRLPLVGQREVVDSWEVFPPRHPLACKFCYDLIYDAFYFTLCVPRTQIPVSLLYNYDDNYRAEGGFGGGGASGPTPTGNTVMQGEKDNAMTTHVKRVFFLGVFLS